MSFLCMFVVMVKLLGLNLLVGIRQPFVECLNSLKPYENEVSLGIILFDLWGALLFFIMI
jgi:hypothetical protein